MDTGFEEAVFGKECIFEGFGTFSGSKIKKITLGEGITELPSTFASFCDNLEQVDMPESLTKIPDDCFSASPKMEKDLSDVLNQKGVVAKSSKIEMMIERQLFFK